MNEQTRDYVNKVAKIVAENPYVTKAVVVGPAVEKEFTFEDKIMLAVFTAPDAKYTKVCSDLHYDLFDHDLTNVELYMTADEDFYAAIYHLIDKGEVIFVKN